MPLVSIQITSGTKVVRPWTIICGFSETCTLSQLWSEHVTLSSSEHGSWQGLPTEFSEYGIECFVGKTREGPFDPIFQSVVICEVVDLFGRFFQFNLCPTELQDTASMTTETENTTTDAFKLMMSKQTEITVPTITETKNKKQIVFNKVCDVISQQKLGWNPSGVGSTGKKCVQVLTDAIWYVDPHVPKLRDRGFRVPEIFYFTGYNNPETHKHKIPSVTCEDLQEHAIKLESFLEQPWLAKPKWESFKCAVTDFADMFHKYTEYLKKQKEITKQNHMSETEVRDVTASQQINILSPKHLVKPTFVARYRKLNEKLTKLAEFESLWLDEFTPSDTRERRYYLDSLSQGIACDSIHLIDMNTLVAVFFRT